MKIFFRKIYILTISILTAFSAYAGKNQQANLNPENEIPETISIFYINSNSEFTAMPSDNSNNQNKKAKYMNRFKDIAFKSLKYNLEHSSENISCAGKNAQLQLPSHYSNFFIEVPSAKSFENIILTPIKQSKKARNLNYIKNKKKNDIIFEDKISYTIQKISNNIFQIITPTLAPGEYVFCQHHDGEIVGVFDFGIDPNLAEVNLSHINESTISAYFSKGIQPLAYEKRKSAGTTKKSAGKQLAQNSTKKSTTPTKTTKNQRSKTLAKTQTPVQSKNVEDVETPKGIKPDVDMNIPRTKKPAENTFALIIANENYTRVSEVPFALNDGRIVKEYLKNTFGLPEKAIIHVENGTLNDMKYSINRISEICKAYNGDVSLFVYYSGHGIPDEATGDGFILPVDGYGTDTSTALSITDLYTTLSQLPTKKTSIFMDACFSGTRRDGDILVAARGVAIKAKTEKPKGNIIAISAAQGDETAYPHQEKQHGLMTYYFLKKLQQTKGNVTLGELFNYVQDNVKKTSIVENGKLQTPSVSVSPALKVDWESITLN